MGKDTARTFRECKPVPVLDRQAVEAFARGLQLRADRMAGDPLRSSAAATLADIARDFLTIIPMCDRGFSDSTGLAKMAEAGVTALEEISTVLDRETDSTGIGLYNPRSAVVQLRKILTDAATKLGITIDVCSEDEAVCDCAYHENKRHAELSHAEGFDKGLLGPGDV